MLWPIVLLCLLLHKNLLHRIDLDLLFFFFFWSEFRLTICSIVLSGLWHIMAGDIYDIVRDEGERKIYFLYLVSLESVG